MARPFFETLRELRSGLTLDELTSALAEVVAAVKGSGKAGEIQLRLKIKPPKKGGTSYLLIEDAILVKAPRNDRGDTIFFPLADNSLSRLDPQQRELELRVVEAADAQNPAAQKASNVPMTATEVLARREEFGRSAAAEVETGRAP